MKFVNLTPHEIVVRTENGRVVFPSSGVARVQQVPGEQQDLVVLGGDETPMPVPIHGASQYGAVEGLPPMERGTLYIVSLLVLAALKGCRPDCVAPGTGPNDNPVRDSTGKLVAVTRLVRG
jgi:hypothetical protein